MAIEMIECEIWVVVDEAGDYAIGKDQEECDENIGGSENRRMVRVVLSVPKPVVPTLTGTVPAEGDATLSVK